MGLTHTSSGRSAIDRGIDPQSSIPRIAVAGNPNVGKSTLFNALTGMNQHTGNWPGKTVASAKGYFSTKENRFELIDIPGTYSLLAHSPEEEVARNFICFGSPDAVIVVCDATCLERNLNLALQIIEVSQKVIVCVNLLDEAKRKHIATDLQRLEELLGVRVVGTAAGRGWGLDSLGDAADFLFSEDFVKKSSPRVSFALPIEEAIEKIIPSLDGISELEHRWLALRLLEGDEKFIGEINSFLGRDVLADGDIRASLSRAREILDGHGIDGEALCLSIVSAYVNAAEKIAAETVKKQGSDYHERDRKIDTLLTGKVSAYPFMILLLLLVFWLTVSGANYPSELLSSFLFWLGDRLGDLILNLGAPPWLHGIIILGAYRVLAWVVAVMLPPMAIFFPLFTLLEDSGYLPRIAYNLDKPFSKCRTCGKQALTMCMGFGCNAAGVVGCRIIDSPRERLIAMITNSFVPCNGRFPILIAIISMFIIGERTGLLPSLASAGILTLFIIAGVFLTLAVSRLLSATLLRGLPSAFTLELPPYRRPQIARVLVRSMLDRTLFVLGRAAAVAAPAGIIIWLMANLSVGGESLLSVCSGFLDPFASIFGLDGVILMAFILGFPANETVIPIIIMAYMSAGTLVEYESLSALRLLLVENGWTITTALCTMTFTLVHWPCSTTLMSIKKESGSSGYTAAAFIIPTLIGFLLCFIINSLSTLFSLFL